MKFPYIKSLAPMAMAGLMVFGVSSCKDDLNQSITDPQTVTEFDANASLAKVYSSLVLTGQTGGSGNADMSQFDEGNSSYYRRIFEANELCSDECIWTWQNDTGIPELTNISWNSSHGYNELTYYRIMYNVTLCNSYLDQTENSDDTQVPQNRAEVRFLRALFMTQFIDLYGKAPFKEHVNTDLPSLKTRKEAFDYVVNELKAIDGEASGTSKEVLLDYTGDDSNYGRADKYAAWMLLARLYLNAEVYTGTAQWELAKEYANKVINGGKYDLCTKAQNGCSAYEQLFMGDNGENKEARKEIILPIRCDGANSRSYGGAIYPIASCTGSGTPDQSLASSMWTCNRARQALIDKFTDQGAKLSKGSYSAKQFATEIAKDDRALFFVDAARTYETEDKTTFTAGFGILKWTNAYCDASNGSPKNPTFPDTDIPYMRLAEAYLTRAECEYRLGELSEAKSDIQTLRRRANCSDLWENKSITLNDIRDEWCREFYFEGRRRSDLIRFGQFTGSDYVWDWKGGTYAGTGVAKKYNLYPIPYNETSANPAITQNPGY